MPSLSSRRLLIANRGEIALRIQRSASLFPRPDGDGSEHFTPLGLFTEAEQDAAHVVLLPVDQRIALSGSGPRAYLDGNAIVQLARQHDVWGIAPGYGFLSESPEFAQAVESASMVWVGPTSHQLALLGDKVKAKQLARQCNVPTLESSGDISASAEQVRLFARSLPDGSQIIIKAVNGGGGRGMRVVMAGSDAAAIDEAYATCAREAKASFGDERVYAERFLADARHIEVQVIGDGTGDVAHVWERECSLQRRHQKLVEIAPSPTLTGGAQSPIRRRIIDAALRMASHVSYRSLGTFEFLLLPESGEFFFMEVNPRIQVEHTITEAITSLDLVAVQLQIATGSTLKDLGLGRTAAPPLFPANTAIQVRLNAERFLSDGSVVPTSGTLQSCLLPSGPGVRVDTAAHAPYIQQGRRVEYRQTALFDSLLAKVIVIAPSYLLAVQLARSALHQTDFVGVECNVGFLRMLLERDEVLRNRGIHTRFVEQHFDELFSAAASSNESSILSESHNESTSAPQEGRQRSAGPPGTEALPSPLSGLVSHLSVKDGQYVKAGDEVALLESMKMEHVVRATHSGVVQQISARQGQPVNEGDALLYIKPSNESADKLATASTASDEQEDISQPRPDLEALLGHRRLQMDAARTEQVKRRRAAGFLTARENVALLVDEGSFIEFGDLMIAAQRTRVDEDVLRQRTSNDGVITGWATVNAALFDSDAQGRASPARCALCIYDYMVLAGTQGHFHHLKLDRLFRSVLDNPSPLILYAEGGGGRPGDVDLVNMKVAGLDTPSFALMAAIRARGYPSIGLANGYTFAGNAALLGTCDIVVATQGGAQDAPSRGATSTGMGGPAMIEGGGLGVVKPQDVGPLAVHIANGDYDVVVPTEREASEMIKRLLGFFQGPLTRSSAWSYTKDPKQLRRLLPPLRTRAYEVRNVIDALMDDGSFIELGRGWGYSIVTGVARIAGQPIGVLASSVMSPLGGAIDAASAQKATRLLNMLHRTRAAHLVVLCDTPGFMVGPQAEKEGGLRAFAEMFTAMMAFQDGQLGGRVFAVTLRKAYGLGAQVMLGGSSISNYFSIAWPQGEYAGMGIEGAVRLGMRKELESVPAGAERDDLFASLVDMMYQRGKAQNMAALAEIDTVIDPAETRQWLLNGLRFTRARIPTWQDERRSHSSHL